MPTVVSPAEARDAIDRVLRCYGVEVAKALDPLDPQDFKVIESKLTRALQGASAGTEGEMLRAAMAKLSVDWGAMTAAQVQATLVAARSAVKAAIPTKSVLDKGIGGVLRIQMPTVAGGAKMSTVAQYGFSIRPSLNAIDRKILNAAAFNQASFVRDEFGRRADSMINIHARTVVQDGMRRGLGREAMRAELQSALGAWNQKASANYWRTVANYTAQTARSYGALSTYAEAGVERYMLQAIIDKKTTPTCRFLDGKEYSVQKAMRNIEQASPQQPLPWVYTGVNQKGGKYLYYKDPSGQRQHVADITRDASGKVGDKGSFSNASPDMALQNAGIDTPPFHGNCRTIIKAIL